VKTVKWEKAGNYGKWKDGKMKMEELLACYSWEGSAPDPVFSRYTRYTATTRANIDDFGDGAATLSRYRRYILEGY